MQCFKKKDCYFSAWIVFSVTLVLFGFTTVSLAEPFEDVTDSVINGITNNKVAWGDFNNDGWVDIYCSVLWRNEGGEKFTEVDGPFGGEGIWGDYDNDGDLDLYLYDSGRLLQNNGTNGFHDVSHILAERDIGSCRCATWGDFNGDGYLDLYITGYEIWETGAEWHDIVFANQQGESFTQVWQTPKVHRARAVTCADYDEDGDLDIYVSNYRLQPNCLWQNIGDFQFTDVAVEAGNVDGDGDLGAWGHTIGSAWCDFDNDGHIDLFVGNFSHAPAYQDRCKIYRNIQSADGFTFQEQSDEIIPWQESYASPAFGDYDNDGFIDLYHTAVYGGDHSLLYRNASADLSPDGPPADFPADKSPIGKWNLVDVSDATGTQRDNSYQAAWADYDNDGDLDLMAGGRLFRNPGNANHWLKLRLTGDGVNAYAIGAQARVHIGNWRITRAVEGATGEGNQNDLTLHFGIGNRTDPVDIEIRWPDGTRKTLKSNVDKTVEIIKSE